MKPTYRKGKAILFPSALSLRYEKQILKLLKDKKIRINKLIIPYLSLFKSNIDNLDFLDQALRQIHNEIDAETALIFSLLVTGANDLIDFSYKQFVNSVSEIIIKKPENGISVDIFSSSLNRDLPALTRSWARTNARLITVLNDNLLNDVAYIIDAGFRNGDSIEKIKNQIQKKFKLSTNKARLIARDQTAKLHSNYILNEFKKFNINEYVWSDSKDERVRTSHRVLNGKICSVHNAEVYKNSVDDKKYLQKSSIGGALFQVGQDINCRCAPIPIIRF